MSFSRTIENRINESRRGTAYRNYLEVRNAVFAMLDADEAASSAPSPYWKEELQGMEYLFDASPLVVETLRHHCYHLTGQREFDYRRHHVLKAGPLKRRLEILKSQDRRGLFIPEPSALGGFGFEIDGALINSDTLKFYEGLVAMENAGILADFKNGGEGKIVLEIGGGWGGFAYQFKKIFPNVHYVIVDFPATLLFSGTYLKTVFGGAKIFLSGSNSSLAGKIDPVEYDFLFLPHYSWKTLSFRRPDILINMESFQEMTTSQVGEYLEKAREWGIPHVYSFNKDRAPYNPELTSVYTVLESQYRVREVFVRSLEYRAAAIKKAKKMIKLLMGQKTPEEFLTDRYRHLIGAR